MTENIISIIFINPHFVNPKINNFRSFFGKNAALTRFSGLPLPVPSVCGFSVYPQLIHTVRRTRTNTSSIFVLSTRYLVTVINIIHNLWITLWITFGFAVYNLWAFPIFPVFTLCIMCI